MPVAYNNGTSLKQSESPLAHLVRRTSSKKLRNWRQPQPKTDPPSVHLNPPTSPLLHTHFARDSIATASSYEDNSYSIDVPNTTHNIYEEQLGSSPEDYGYHQYFDDRNIASGSPALRDSWRSTDPDATSGNSENFANSRHLSNDPLPSSPQKEQHPRQVNSYAPLPSVLVSMYDPPLNNRVESATVDTTTVDTTVPDGRISPVVRPVTNFSRPIHKAGQPEHAGAMGERVAPQLPPGMREAKLKVLERNAKRGMARLTSPNESVRARSPLSQTNVYTDGLRKSGTPSTLTKKLNVSLISKMTGWSQSPGTGSVQEVQQQHRSQSPSTAKLYPQPPPMVSSNTSLHPSSKDGEIGTSVTPVSLYSIYSYYEYESAMPSPPESRPSSQSSSQLSSQLSSQSSSQLSIQSSSQPSTRLAQPSSRPKTEQVQDSRTSSNGPSPRPLEGLRTPQDFLHLGIQHHEANRLQESARCFERSATEDGGCGVGMLMYGLTLRHGWGCVKNEKAGFKWLRKAAEHAVEDLERVRMNGDMDVRVVEVN